jgi:SAM-dependent methyltransferase
MTLMTLPKPRHFGAEYAATFKDKGVAEAYLNRPPYPAEAIELLASLVVDEPHAVLDVGCGTGDVARRLAPLVDRVDAVDYSEAMIERGRLFPGAGHPSLNWIHAPVESAPLSPPYALITAGESLHWLDWEVVFPRFVEAISPSGCLAIVERDWNLPPALRARVGPLYAAYSTNRDYRPTDMIEELAIRGLFEKRGDQRTRPVPWRPTLDEYVALHHSQSSFPRARMGAERSAAFDAELRRAIADLRDEGHVEVRDGRLELTIDARVVWGRPTWRQ